MSHTLAFCTSLPTGFRKYLIYGLLLAVVDRLKGSSTHVNCCSQSLGQYFMYQWQNIKWYQTPARNVLWHMKYQGPWHLHLWCVMVHGTTEINCRKATLNQPLLPWLMTSVYKNMEERKESDYIRETNTTRVVWWSLLPHTMSSQTTFWFSSILHTYIWCIVCGVGECSS